MSGGRFRIREVVQPAHVDLGDLVYLVESPRFEAFREMDGGRNARFLLGDALGRAGAHNPARAYLTPLLDMNPPDIWARRHEDPVAAIIPEPGRLRLISFTKTAVCFGAIQKSILSDASTNW